MRKLAAGSASCDVFFVGDLPASYQIEQVGVAAFGTHVQHGTSVHVERTVKFVLPHPESIPLELDAPVPNKPFGFAEFRRKLDPHAEAPPNGKRGRGRMAHDCPPAQAFL